MSSWVDDHLFFHIHRANTTGREKCGMQILHQEVSTKVVGEFGLEVKCSKMAHLRNWMKTVLFLAEIYPTFWLNPQKMHYISTLSHELGIPWETSKDQPLLALQHTSASTGTSRHVESH